MVQARAEVFTGIGTGIISMAGIWSHEILPVISDIGICAAAFVAVHGTCRIVYKEIKTWMTK